jgi:cytochrome c peroxidase
MTSHTPRKVFAMNCFRRFKLPIIVPLLFLAIVTGARSRPAQGEEAESRAGRQRSGRHLFERETFGGNGRTCLTCHSRETGTVSPQDARARFAADPHDPLFLHDGSDDGIGNGVTRMLSNATILVTIPFPSHVHLEDDPYARSVTLRRGIPSTLNTPALDPILMLDGRHHNLRAQARAAIHNHAQNTVEPSRLDLLLIGAFQQAGLFFSSPELRKFARGGPAPKLPHGRTAAEKRGRRFFEDVPFTSPNQKDGACAACHSGPMLNESSSNFPLLPAGTRFQSIAVSEFNAAGNPVRKFVFKNPDGTETKISSPDPGRALITGVAQDRLFTHVNAFKIPSLWGVARTAPYFHDNSAKTLEDVMQHYAQFFELVTNKQLILTEQDQADIVAYMKILP